MATFKQTMKDCLFGYPTIFPNPSNVCVHLFAIIGNGYDWVDGELVDTCSLEKKRVPKMKYPERGTDSVIAHLSKFHQSIPKSIIRELGLELKDDAEVARMKWTEKNIKAILDARPTNTYFGEDRRGYYVTKGISVTYAHGLNFPDDIKDDWARALFEFLEWWLVQLNHEYGADMDQSSWPQDIQNGRKAILDARERLYPLIHNGKTWKKAVAEQTALVNKALKNA